MTTALLTRTVLMWLAFMPIAILNGIAREKLYSARFGDLTAHQLSTVIAVAAYFALAYFTWRGRVENLDTKTLFLIGGVWVFMTIGFEFGFGHYVDGRSWEWLLGDYDVFKGRVWGLFLLFMLLTPNLVKLVSSHLSR